MTGLWYHLAALARVSVALVPDCEQAIRLLREDPSGKWAVH